MSMLTRFQNPGDVFVSVNVGYAPHSRDDVDKLLAYDRAKISASDVMYLVSNVADIASQSGAGRIGVAFDLEDSGPLDMDLDNVHRFAELGVRTMLPTYNHANAAGCGSLDVEDTGLTAWGRAITAEMNSAGMVPDGSHCSVRTGLDLCEISSKPVVYSHSCMRSVWDHPRNITDDQAIACAGTGGVIGITGVGIFLGPNTPTLDAMTQHIEYAANLVGVEHVGVSTDFSFDYEDFLAEVATNPQLFDENYTRWGPIQWMPPETFLRLGQHLKARGWGDHDVAAVLGGNFRRVAAQSWSTATPTGA
ncbi:membrane dipeptidase [Hoyosella rhizosphaerae]|uniref:Membrane dipeptidase n=1 Tax=Hoyosella rhizosphaerae TaxID=1755582 RepID=A0A916TZC1_9ACTN|nr:membrane dipeptidase [Hoyosella rhizosphaerae]